MSVGAAAMLVTEEASASWLVQRADVALYASKKTGRNRVTSARTGSQPAEFPPGNLKRSESEAPLSL